MPPKKTGRLQRATCYFFRGTRRAGGRLWPFASARRRAAARDWARRLTEERVALQVLISETEQEFLATGAGLTGLAQGLNEIQLACQSLTDLTLGQDEDAAIQFAFQLLKKAEDLVLASYEQYDQVFETFRNLQGGLAQLSKQHNELMRALVPLDFITISFRIEASRHSEEVQGTFFTLAATINETVAKVRTALQRQFTDLANSQQIALDLMAQVSASTQQHRQEVAATLATSRTQLCALGTAITNSGAGAAELAQLNLAVSRHIGGMVMAQQCQDITRQRLEHVGEALDEMRGLLVNERTGATPNHSQFIGQAAQIQWKQAASVFAELNRAANSLKTGIQSLRSEAGAAAKAAIQVGGSALDARFSSQCQAGISQILASVRQAVQKIAEIATAFAPLQASFANCTSQASQLAGDVRMAALNAQIFALHATNGGTLEVLAGRVRVISDDTLQNVETMGIALRRTDEMVSHLRERLADFQHIGQAEQAVLAEESKLSLQKLADLESAIPGLIQRITRQQGDFVQSAEQVLAEVKFPATVATANSRSTDFFRDLINWSDAGPKGAAKMPPQLERLAQKYTMESERQVHASALCPVPASFPKNSLALPAENSGPSERIPSDASEPAFATSSLGENVELF